MTRRPFDEFVRFQVRGSPGHVKRKLRALMTTSAGGHTDAFKLLLENGTDVRAADYEGITTAVLKLLSKSYGDHHRQLARPHGRH